MEANNKLCEALECNHYEKIIDALVLIANEAEVLMAALKRDNANSLHITSASNIINVARNTIAFPRRQCDVGTVEEQFTRFEKFCRKDVLDPLEASAYCAYECPCGRKYNCELAWAQMPYEEKEGGAE